MPLSHAEATGNINPILTDVLNNYSLNTFNWFDEFVAPSVKNNGNLSGQVPINDTENIRQDNDIHAPGKDPNIIDLSHKQFQSYDLEPHSLGFIQEASEDKRIAQGGMDPELELYSRIEGTKLKLAINKHRALYTLVSTSGNYDASAVTPAGTAWSSAAADPCENVRTNAEAIEALRGLKPNAGCINSTTFRYLKHHVNITSRLSSDVHKIATLDDLKMLFDLDYLFVTNARYDSSLPAGTATPTHIWGNIMLLFYKPTETFDLTTLRNYPTFAACIRNEDVTTGGVVETVDLGSSKSGLVGGYCYQHNVKLGYYKHLMTYVDDASTPDSMCGGIITGLY